VYRRSFSRS